MYIDTSSAQNAISDIKCSTFQNALLETKTEKAGAAGADHAL